MAGEIDMKKKMIVMICMLLIIMLFLACKEEIDPLANVQIEHNNESIEFVMPQK